MTDERQFGWMNVIHIDKNPNEYVTHIVPIGDSYAHDTEKCWCQPIDDGYEVIHFAADQREAYEEGIRKPH